MRPPTKSELRRAEEAAAWRPRPGAQPANRAGGRGCGLSGGSRSSRVPCAEFVAQHVGTAEIGLRLIDCPIFVGPNGPGAALPSKPVLDCEGRPARPSGKPQFAPVVEWRNRGLAERFSAAVIALVEGAASRRAQ